MVEKSSAWKLSPNIYRLKDHFQEVAKKKMGKLGPYQCFTVERDANTVKNHFAVKPADEISDIFYDLPSLMDEMMKTSNRYKAKFLKGERFEVKRLHGTPPPTKYYPQNFVIKAKSAVKGEVDKPLFYYPNTSVPVKEMLFNKENFVRPAPGRYNPHDITCKCYLTKDNKRCPGYIHGDGHCHVFDSTAFRLVHPVKLERRRTVSEPSDDDNIIRFPRPPREPISFRVRRSISSDDLMQNRDREIRYNTMVKKRNLFSVKTGRPVAFLTASPRFKEKSEVAIKLEKEKKKMMLALEEPEKPPRKPITKERLEELAKAKNPLPKIVSKKLQVFEKLPQMPTENLVKKTSIIKSEDLSRLSELALNKQTVESS